jgi:hypothetical protein
LKHVDVFCCLRPFFFSHILLHICSDFCSMNGEERSLILDLSIATGDVLAKGFSVCNGIVRDRNVGRTIYFRFLRVFNFHCSKIQSSTSNV